MKMKPTLPCVLLGFIAALSGCGGGNNGSPRLAPTATPTAATPTAAPTPTAIPMREPATRALKPFRDPWPSARPRLWDIDDQPFNAFIHGAGFSYAAKQVVLSYDAKPRGAFFTAHVRARGLKPNFAYQVKLAGKPTLGVRGWKQFGDDTANERIGRANRWWCDTEQQNVDDAHFDAAYKNATPATAHSVYGYQYLGDFVTDASGNADSDVSGEHPYHIAWQNKQTYGTRQVVQGDFLVGSTQAPFYGYGKSIAPKTIRLWYEYEHGRPDPEQLPDGTYNCRILITEETFHNLLGGTSNINGGFYQTVLASEDFDAQGNPDSDASNDVVFAIGTSAQPGASSALTQR